MLRFVWCGGWEEIDGCLVISESNGFQPVLADGGVGEQGGGDGIKVAIAEHLPEEFFECA